MVNKSSHSKKHNVVKYNRTDDLQPTPKAKAVLDKLLADPLANKSKVYREVYGTDNVRASNANSSKLLKRESSQIYLKKHERFAKKVIADVLHTAYDNRDKPAFSRIAVDTANSLLDRQLGKPVQQQQIQSNNININVEASQELKENFLEFIKNKTANDIKQRYNR
jgi:hypothetical protein